MKKEKEVELKGLDEDYFKKGIKNHPKTKDCDDDECMLCGYRDCPHNEPLHYHHDGCPACLFEGIEVSDEDYQCEEAGDEFK